MISTRDLSELRDIEALRRLMQSLAMLDAILSPEWEYRYFSFNSRWAPLEQMGSMRNGQGDHYFAMFGASGCWLKGFDHEAPMSPFASTPPKMAAGVLDGVPAEFAACLTQPAFMMDETTFCIWRRYGDAQWQHGPLRLPDNDQDVDGSAVLLRYLGGQPQTYHQWAQDYYEHEVPLSAIRAVYAHQPLDRRLLGELNADATLAGLRPDVDEIGYPAH